MAKPNLRIAGEIPSRSPEREQLAKAIERQNATALHRDRLQGALKRAEAQLYGDDSASRAVETAEAVLAEAKADESRHLAAVALSEATEDANPVTAAESAIAEAQSRLDTARRTRDALKEQLKAAESELSMARLRLDSCVDDVINASAPVEKLLADFATLHREFVMHRRVLEWLEGQGAIPREVSFRAEPREWADAGEAPWNAAVSALATDADAPLPN
jgi:chromosome segregation ATPase